MSSSLLHIYTEGHLKNYQLEGNLYNYEIDLIQSKGDEMLTIITPWTIYTSAPTVSSFVMYSVNRHELKYCETYAQFILLRESYLTLSPSSLILESKTVGSDIYYRFSATDVIFPSFVASGVYEFVIIAGGITFESELFSTCLMNSLNISRLVCNSATLPAIDYGDTPTLTINIGETGGKAAPATVNVIWEISFASYFAATGGYVFPLTTIFGTGSTNIEQSETQTIPASSNSDFIFTIPNILQVGIYTVKYSSNVVGCSGVKTLTVSASWFTIDSGGWDETGIVYGTFDVPFSITISNSDASAKTLHIQLLLDGVIQENINQNIAGLGSLTIDRDYNIFTGINHTLQVLGDVNNSYTFNAKSPT